MKKAFSLLLAVLVFAALLSVPAMAEETVPVALNEAGITLNLPASYLNTMGIVDINGGEELDPGSDMYCTEIYYLAMTPEELDELDLYSEDGVDFYMNSRAELFVIYALGPGLTVDDLLDLLNSRNPNSDYYDAIDTHCLTEIAQEDGYTFYLYEDSSMMDDSAFRPEFQQEYQALLGRTQEVLSLSNFQRPVDHHESLTGTGLDFVTTDLDGNEISSMDLFAQHEITVLNVWASWCGPCQGELPELEALNQRLASKDCAVVGLLYDGDEPEAVQDAKAVMNEKGVTYLVICPPENVDDIFDLQCYPTTFYISRDGNFIGSPTEGADVEENEMKVDEYLGSRGGAYRSKKGGHVGQTDNVMPNDAGVYRVYVADEHGDPVQGAAVQFCSDDQCMMAKTDENGVAVFEVAPGHYVVHILKVPAEYEKDRGEYVLSDTYSDVVVVLNFK